MFLRKSVLKISSKFTGEHPCRSVILIKLQSNFIEITFRHGCSPVNLLHIFRTLLLKHLWKAVSERYSLLYLYSISLASRTRGKKTLFLFWRYVATTENILSKRLKFCSILFHFALFSFYSTGSPKSNTPTRWILTTLRKARENVCEQSSHEFFNAVKFSQLLSPQHAMPPKILQFWLFLDLDIYRTPHISELIFWISHK